MEIHKLFTDERAVSPVVGVALLIAIAVILAAVIGAVVLGLGAGSTETPQAQLQADFDASNDRITISHQGGDTLPQDEVLVVPYGDQADAAELSGDLSAGESQTFGEGEDSEFAATSSATLQEGDKLAIVWQDPNSDAETVLEEFTADDGSISLAT